MARLPRLTRRWHRLGAIVTALPFLVVILTGLLLQMKKDWSWVQPPTQSGAAIVPSLSYEAVLEAVRAVPEAEVGSWGDVDRLDVRPNKGMLKVRCNNGIEVQLDSGSGAVLQVAKRRSDWLESLHDGSWFHPLAKLWLFLPVALVILFLWGSGIYLWILPHNVRRRKRQRLRQQSKPEQSSD